MVPWKSDGFIGVPPLWIDDIKGGC